MCPKGMCFVTTDKFTTLLEATHTHTKEHTIEVLRSAIYINYIIFEIRSDPRKPFPCKAHTYVRPDTIYVPIKAKCFWHVSKSFVRLSLEVLRGWVIKELGKFTCERVSSVKVRRKIANNCKNKSFLTMARRKRAHLSLSRKLRTLVRNRARKIVFT